jgi:hypothetical protein
MSKVANHDPENTVMNYCIFQSSGGAQFESHNLPEGLEVEIAPGKVLAFERPYAV